MSDNYRMKKILFASIESKYIHSNPALLYLKKISSLYKCTPHIESFTINQHPYDILAAIVNYQPDVICFSVYIWNTTIVKELLSDLPKIMPEAVIVMGGPEVTYNPERWLLHYPAIDYIVTGAGEAGWKTLLETDFDCENKIIVKKNIPFNEIPFPYDEEILFNEQGSKIVYYESSRGCPFKCSFCLSSRDDIKLEYRDVEKVKKELNFFIERKIPLVKFVDRTFNANREHSKAIWKHLLENNSDTRFHFEINPVLLTEEDIELLQKVPDGWFQFEIGIQSTHSPTLKEIGRKGGDGGSDYWQQLFGKIKKLQTNIHIHLDIITGLPYEGYTEVQQSFNEVYSVKADAFQCGMLKVLPGTQMERKAQQYEMEYQQEPPYRILQSKWMSFSQLNKLHNIEHLVNNLYNSHKFIRTLNYLENQFNSPFELYAKLEDYWQEKKIHFWLKDWSKTAQIIIDFIGSDDDILLDCLRWDLCFNTSFHSYPSFLMNSELEKLLSVWHSFKKLHSSETSELVPDSFLKNRRNILYKPLTVEFYDRYNISVDNCYIIIKDRQNKHIQVDFRKIKETTKQ